MEETTKEAAKEVPDCCKAGSKNTKSYFMPAIMGILLLIAIFQAVQINSMKSITANVVLSAANANTNANGINMAGWTEDEKMMYEHHGTLPDRIKSSQPQGQPQQAGMVGGC